jgi:predicted phosphohydrolase
MSRLFVCGDTHGLPYDTRKLNGRSFSIQKKLTKNDVVVILGDFGWVWYPFGADAQQEHYLDWFAQKPYTLAVIPGNHDNYDLIESLPLTSQWGAQAYELKRPKGSIYFLRRGEAYLFGQKRILTIGGALSIDKDERTPHKSWWPQELLKDEEKERTLRLIKRYNGKFDYIFTHTAPISVIERLRRRHPIDNAKCEDPTAHFLEEVKKHCSFRSWHFGHFHTDDVVDDIFFAHYRNPPLEIE